MDTLLRFDLPAVGTMANMHQRLSKHLKSVSDQDVKLTYPTASINFCDYEKQPLFEAFYCIDEKLMYVARSEERTGSRVILSSDGIGI